MKIQRLVKLGLLWIGSILFRNKKSKILFYHDVYTRKGYVAPDCGIVMGTPLDVFKKHVEAIKAEGFRIVPHITEEEGEVCIMLDDGFRGVWENRHYFYEHNICPTIFLAVDLIGQDGFLNTDEIIELQNHGFIFESHGWTHTNLTTKNDNELTRELKNSRIYLSKMLQKDVQEICLPIGYFSNHLIEMARKQGYSEIYSSIPGEYTNKIYGTLRPRILCQFASPFEVKLLLRGGGNIIRKRYECLHHQPNFIS